MTERERAMRVACVSKMLAAFGDVSTEQAQAIVDMTAGIPWFVPREESRAPRKLLFASAVVQAGLDVTYGRPKPGDILAAAIDIGGHCRTDQGHTSERRWVAAARRPVAALPFPREEMFRVEGGSGALEIEEQTGRGHSADWEATT